ncbi:MAG TPA: AbrB/MazE/SpoVT family DNA-binding domain-containing protein [Candidatus Saccharimonadales bacterium]
MKTTITMTSKGQFTLPAEVRKELGLNANGATLQLEFSPEDRTIKITKPVTLSELQYFVQSAAKQPANPLPDDIHSWYEEERIKDLKQRGAL